MDRGGFFPRQEAQEHLFNYPLARLFLLMARKVETVMLGRQFDCAACRFRDRPIFIVGSQQFSADLLGNYIRANRPALTTVVNCLADIPHPDGLAGKEWRLIFIDCHGLEGAAILEMLHTEATPYLQYDVLALFNLSQGNADIAGYIDCGVRGFFFENDQPDVMLRGVCALKYGEMWVARGVLMDYICQKPRKAPKSDSMACNLTRREKEILIHLSSGATNEEIASRLYVSLHTVKSHIFNIYKKLQVRNRLQAAMWAARNLK
ncbi:MAG: DNA-binding response regulator [Desulfobulbus sp.]|nr:MAG: DNA-binding response regulator [Desulfobulbus sp.]